MFKDPVVRFGGYHTRKGGTLEQQLPDLAALLVVRQTSIDTFRDTGLGLSVLGPSKPKVRRPRET